MEEKSKNISGEIASNQSNPVKEFLHKEVSVTSTDKANDDTIVDVKVNNPLKKITKLLEDIKKQKAFSFNIRGSLGIAGIFLVITVFGIFGGTKAFCSKGEQSHLGTIVVLAIQEEPDNSWITRAKTIWNAMLGKESKEEKNLSKVVLIEQNQMIYQLLGLTSEQKKVIKEAKYIVTGNVDSCSQTVTIEKEKAIELYQ